MRVSKIIERKKISVLGIAIFVIGFMIVFLLQTNKTRNDALKWNILPEMTDQEREKTIDELCRSSEKLYFPTTINSPFPSQSPNGMYFIDLQKSFIGQKDILIMYQQNTGKKIGSYTSRLSELVIYCWDEDNSGIYISDYERGSGSIFVTGGKPSKYTTVKKLLVPE